MTSAILNRAAAFRPAILLLLLTAVAAPGIAQVPKAVDGIEKQRYFLIGDPANDPPANGWGVLVVLPGGDGSADFHAFVTNIGTNFAPPGYLAIQLVAVEGDPKLTWPTKHSLRQTKKQSFTTEQHVAAVLKEVAAGLPEGVRLDPAKRLVLGWSSGGPAAYAIAADKDLGFAGAFVAMSIFAPRDVQPAKEVAGKRFALLQSPQDQVTPWRHVAQAEEVLTRAGASVWKRGYAGGHGWQGDSLDKLRDGLAWLAGG